MSTNPDSILDSVKKALGFEAEYTAFDVDITMFINGALGELQQLGVGSPTGFVIADNTTLWSQYISQVGYLGMVKMFVYLFVKLAFDPPERFGISAIQNQMEKLTWRINVAVEGANPPSAPDILGKSVDAIINNFFESDEMQAFFIPKVAFLDFDSVVTPDALKGNTFYITLTDDCTINAPVNGLEGAHITLEVTSNGHSVTWGSGWNFGNSGQPILSGGGKTDIISAVYREFVSQWWAGYTPGF